MLNFLKKLFKIKNIDVYKNKSQNNFGLLDVEKERLNIFFKKNTIIEKVYIFGSRARGDFKEKSDLDLAIVFENKVSDFEKINILQTLREINVIYTIDVIDFEKVYDKKFLENINKDKIVFFEK